MIPGDIGITALAEVEDLVDTGRVEISDSFNGCDTVVTLGGDGTLLRASRLVEDEQIPLLGIKIRSLGFLTEDDPERALRDLFDGEYLVQDRMRLDIVHFGKEGKRSKYTALNDAVLHGMGVSRVIHLRTSIDGMLLGEYLADGVIIATPTGSTAYSLAAGGPIIDPVNMETMIITPLCPHSLSVRPLVISGREEITIELIEDGDESMLTIDGQQANRVDDGDRIEVKRCDKVTRLIVNRDYSFYDLVRRKLKWGGVLRKH
jgi:NAD+ kinase